MDAERAYVFGQAITDTQQAARTLWKVMLPHGRSSAWFALGYWQYSNPTKKEVDDTFTAIQEHMACLAYEGLRQPADDAWREWLLYAPVCEARRCDRED